MHHITPHHHFPITPSLPYIIYEYKYIREYRFRRTADSRPDSKQAAPRPLKKLRVALFFFLLLRHYCVVFFWSGFSEKNLEFFPPYFIPYCMHTRTALGVLLVVCSLSNITTSVSISISEMNGKKRTPFLPILYKYNSILPFWGFLCVQLHIGEGHPQEEVLVFILTWWL